jgi:hypothetical protein
MKTYKHLANAILIFSLLFTACVKSNLGVDTKMEVDTKTDTIPKHVQTSDIYVAGSTYDSVTNVRQAVYWKNGNPVILTHGKKNASANAIAVKGNDVYVAGYTTNPNNVNMAIATYWKNGVQMNLTTNATSASTVRIAIHGNDVYITGYINTSAVYWKNGEQVTLPLLPGMTIGGTAGIAIQGSDIYVSGYQLGGTASAVYWKNGVATRLPNDEASYAKNIVFQGNRMYIPATYLLSSSQNTRVNYWKNTVPVSLADGTVAINAIEIAVSGNDVYLACSTSNGPGYFKNDKLTLLSGSGSQITGIAVVDKDVYASGSTYEKKVVATYWKNNVPVHLSSPIGKSGTASAILVTPSK